MAHILPTKLSQYLVRLQIAYSTKASFLGDALAHSHYLCVEDTAYDNWNGGIYGHDLVLFMPLDQIGKLDIDDQSSVSDEIKEKLNKCAAAIEDEFINLVRIEVYDENDPECLKATAFSKNTPINPDNLSFWKPGLARVFVSHRDAHKVAARELGDALAEYGMSCFVAHDTIKPMTTWRHEILKGLKTMEVMVLFLTDDFQDSWYCHQEIGYALGRNIPIISLKLGQKDPPGFISEVQAARGNIERPVDAARKLFPLIGEALGRGNRLHDVLIDSFLNSPSFSDVKIRFDLMTGQISNLNEQQTEKIISHFNKNGQLHNSIYLTSKYNRLTRFLEKTTDKRWHIQDGALAELEDSSFSKTSSPKNSYQSKFRVGMQVVHKKFGFGSVAEIDDNKLEVDFEIAGRRRIMDAFVSPV